jgi:hypothetical protein
VEDKSYFFGYNKKNTSMNFLFWLLWIVNVLLLLLAVAGSGFRSSFGANTDMNGMITILVIIILIASIWLKLSVRQKWISLAVVAIPVLFMFFMYLFEKKTGQGI